MADRNSDSTVTTSLSPVDAKAEVRVTPNKLEASIIITAPQNGGANLTLEQLKAVLEAKGVVYGLHEDQLLAMSRSPMYSQPTVVAEGMPCTNGDDAVLNYKIRTERNMKPKEKPDGSVDFRDLGLIEVVQKGAVLCEKKPATPGVPGTDVYGKEIAPKPGKEVHLPMGKNTEMSEDKLILTASITGQAEIINNKITVLDTFTVKGDVSTATGDIHFSGNVVVTGGVASGFSVQASGNVDVAGVVEAATIMAGGNLIIRGGFNGGEAGTLNVGENMACKFVQGGSVTLGGNLETTYILNAKIHCGGIINLVGKGLIMGGHIAARTSVNANWLGSANTMSATIIEVGNDPALIKRSYEIPKELETCLKNMRSIEAVVKALLQLKSTGRLTPDKAVNLDKSVRYFTQLKDTYTELQEEFVVVQQKLSEVGQGTVKVQKTAYPGVKIIIGSEQFPLHSEYTFTKFIRTRDGISCGPLR